MTKPSKPIHVGPGCSCSDSNCPQKRCDIPGPHYVRDCNDYTKSDLAGSEPHVPTYTQIYQINGQLMVNRPDDPSYGSRTPINLRISICDDCGNVVSDLPVHREAHNAWHEQVQVVLDHTELSWDRAHNTRTGDCLCKGTSHDSDCSVAEGRSAEGH